MKPVDQLKSEKPNAKKISDVTCKGRRFEVWHDTTEAETTILSGYYLVTPRGVVYVLSRNIPKPALLFPIALYGDLSVPQGLWFRERAPGQIEAAS